MAHRLPAFVALNEPESSLHPALMTPWRGWWARRRSGRRSGWSPTPKPWRRRSRRPQWGRFGL
uniref:Uncharacterized protein n=1 Tax=Phenylobacterium glaciei TaxID=2803784 RepID=A0A974P0Q8_9CAUL|nr:hypothetical protein JKL49_14790 [Phenylobacterium glaciei]